MLKSAAVVGAVLPQPVTALAMAGSGLCVASAETVIGSLDQLDSVATISAGYARLATGGLLHLLAAVLLAFALVGLAPLVWRSVVGRVGWLVALVGVPCAGGFAMLHLLALEVAAPTLDAAAMDQFLLQRLGAGGGPWLVPLLWTALLMPVAHLLLVFGLARRKVAPWAAPVLLVVGALVHQVVPGEFVEVMSHWVIASGLVVAAAGVWLRQPRPRESDVSR